jgi:hypothetical protein
MVDEASGKYWHRPCFDQKDKGAAEGEGSAEDRGLCPVCNLMVTTAHPRTVDEPTGQYYHRTCYEERDKVADVADHGEDAEEGGDGEGEEGEEGANKTGTKKKRCTMEGCKKSMYKNNYCAQHFREQSGFNTVNFAKMMGGDNSMDMKQMTKNYKAMTMKMSKKGPISIGGAAKKESKKSSGGVGNAMIAPSKKFLERNSSSENQDMPTADLTGPADFVKCQMCDEKEAPHAATNHCEDCDEDMCDVLARAHQRAKMSKGHVLTPIGGAKESAT